MVDASDTFYPSRVIEVSDSEEERGNTKYFLMPRAQTGSTTGSTAPELAPIPILPIGSSQWAATPDTASQGASVSAASQIASAQVASEATLDVTSMVLFEDDPCPPLDINKSFWLTFNGNRVGVFDDK